MKDWVMCRKQIRRTKGKILEKIRIIKWEYAETHDKK